MSAVESPRSIGLKLDRASDQGVRFDAGQSVMAQLNAVLGVELVPQAGSEQANGTSIDEDYLATSTFAGFGSNIGVRQNFDTVRFSIFPFDANDLPRFVRVRIRYGTYDATIQAEVLIPLGDEVQVNTSVPVVAELGAVLTNAGGADVWLEFLTDGKVGYEGSTVATTVAAPGWLRYTTTQTLVQDPLPNAVTSPGYQIYAKTFISGSENSWTNGTQSLAYSSGTFTGWANILSALPGEFNVVEMPVYAIDANVLPKQIRVRFRQGTVDGGVIATAVADVNHTDVGYRLARFFFDENVILSGTVWCEFVSDGRVGFPHSSVLGSLSEYYSVRAASVDQTVHQAATPVGFQPWFRSVLRKRSAAFGATGGKIVRAITRFGGGGSSATPFTPSLDITIPPFVPAIEGIETNIYWDGCFTSWLRPELYNIRVNCARGRHDDKRWRIVPSSSGYGPAGTSDLGNNEVMTVEARYNGELIDSASVTIRIKAASVGNGVSRKCLVIGDSTTAGGGPTQQILDNTAANGSSTWAVTLLGTQGSGSNKHEGHSGKTYAWLRTAESPFYSGGDFDFAQYLTDNSYMMSSGDSVFLLMGINDQYGNASDDDANTDALAMMADIAYLIADIQGAVPGIKVWLGMVIPPSHDQSAFGNNYPGSSQYRDRYNRNIGLFRRQLLDTYGASEGSNVYLAPINCNLDTENNMSTATEPLNARNATTTAVQNNGVHPAASGYQQIGDMLYCCLMSVES